MEPATCSVRLASGQLDEADARLLRDRYGHALTIADSQAYRDG